MYKSESSEPWASEEYSSSSDWNNPTPNRPRPRRKASNALSEKSGDTATGNGFKLPLFISTSINE